MLEGSNEDRNTRTLDRRTLLRYTGASTVAGALTALSGCSSNTDTQNEQTDNTGTNEANPGQPVPEIHFLTWTESYSPELFEGSRRIVSELEELGLQLEMDPQQYPQPLISLIFQERGFDMHHISLEGVDLRLDPSFFLSNILHSGNRSEGGWNIPGFQNEDFDALSEEQERLLEPEERREVVYEAQKLAHQEQAWTVHLSADLSIGLNTNKFEMNVDEMVPGEGHFDMWFLTSVESATDDNTYTLGRVAPEIRTLNPLDITESGDISIFRTMYDPLMRLNSEGQAENWIIDDLTIDDNTTITIELTDGLSFHDGEPLTAEDVVFSFQYQKEQESPYVFSFLEVMDEAVAEDDQTVTFHLAEEYAPFTSLTLTQVPILPKHIWNNITDNEDVNDPRDYQNEPAIGSGPFTFERHEPSEQLELSSFDEHPQAPNVDTLRIALMGDVTSATQALARGQVDSADDIPNTLWSEIESSDVADLFFTPDHGLEAILHNRRRGMPFTDLAFRQAVAHAIPRQRMISDLWEDHASPGGSIITDANKFWHNPEVEPLEYDLEKARDVLSEAGYDWNDEGRLLLPE